MKWYHEEKGYGFITLNDGSSVYVHYLSLDDNCKEMLREGVRVEFELGENNKGYFVKAVQCNESDDSHNSETSLEKVEVNGWYNRLRNLFIEWGDARINLDNKKK